MTVKKGGKAPRLLAGTAVCAGLVAGVATAKGADDDVVITAPPAARSQSATKTDTPLIETPQSITIVTNDRFVDQGAQDLEDIVRYAGNVRTEVYGVDSRGDWIQARGADMGLFIDGLRGTSGYYNTTRPAAYGIDRVEVLRGPASVLYGQGTIGGLVNVITKRPEKSFRGEIGASYGTFDRREVFGDVTGSIDNASTLRYRLTAELRESDTQTDYVPDDRVYIAPALTLAPTPRTSFTLLTSYQDDKSGSTVAFLPHSGVVLPNPNGQISFSRFVSEPGFDEYNARQASVSLISEHKFTPRIVLRQTARYTSSAVSYQTLYPDSYTNPLDPFIDADDRVLDRYIYVSKPKLNTFGADANLQAGFGSRFKHTFLGGFDYSRTRQTGRSGFDLSTPINLYAPVYGNYTYPDLFDDPPVESEQYGFYIQDQVKIDNRFVVLASVRRDHAESWTEDGAGEKQKDDATTKRIGAVYLFDNGVAPYVSYSESFEPVAGLDEFDNPYPPVRGEQWEVGVKYAPKGGSFLVTGAVYQTTQPNALLPGPNPLFSIQGPTKYRGFELEGSTKVMGKYDLLANYSFSDSDQFGKEHLASLWASRKFDFGAPGVFQIGAGARYLSGATDPYDDFVQPGYDPVTNPHPAPFYFISTPAVTITDAMMSWTKDDWRIALNATNLFDKQYASVCLGRGDCFIGARRSVVASIVRKF